MSVPLIVIGTMIKSWGAHRAAEGAERAAARIRAAKERAAGLEIALSQQGAQEEKRRARLVASRALALAAAGGGGASDPTVVNLMAGISGEGAYRAAVRIYEGEESARRLREEGSMAAEAGRYQAQAYRTESLGALLSAGGSLYGKYGSGGPGKTDSLDLWSE